MNSLHFVPSGLQQEHDIQRLGQRLDQARLCADHAVGVWARQYWTHVVEQLETQWQRSPAVNDGLCLAPEIVATTVDHNWLESHMGQSPDWTQRWLSHWLGADLEVSWNQARTKQLVGGV